MARIFPLYDPTTRTIQSRSSHWKLKINRSDTFLLASIHLFPVKALFLFKKSFGIWFICFLCSISFASGQSLTHKFASGIIIHPKYCIFWHFPCFESCLKLCVWVSLSPKNPDDFSSYYVIWSDSRRFHFWTFTFLFSK